MAISEKATTFAGFPVISYNAAVGLVLPTMPRRFFRYPDTLGDLFLSISVEQNRLSLGSGKVGAETTEIQEFPDAASALRGYSDLVDSIVARGYTEQQQPGDPVRAGLISALVANPDDHVSRMAFADYLTEQAEQLPAIAYRVDEAGYGEQGYGTIANLRSFLAEPTVGFVQALVVGSCWAMADSDESSAEVVQALLEARDRLINLRALFLGDIVCEECEISWIVQSDLTSLLSAFPRLEHFRTRGGNQLVVRAFEHQHLQSLVFEASNLPSEVVRAVGASKLPSLEHLELWLGTDEYGADTTPDDLEAILQGNNLPSLRYLGLRNSEIADDIARVLANAPVTDRIRELDLSLGTLSDAGAEALLAIPALRRLEKLDVHHHYVSPELVERLEAVGIEVDASEPMEAQVVDENLYRYVAHDE